MRHQKKGYKLGRTQAHRTATLTALSNALIAHKRIRTTLTKARALRMYVEPIINRAKEDSMHNRREVFRSLKSKEAVKELFGEIAGKVANRPGGYTRIVKLGQRAGDSAELAVIELVDYNLAPSDKTAAGSTRRRTRRGRPSAKSAAAASTEGDSAAAGAGDEEKKEA
jgi:large subunit ribosomal protein L17